MWWLFSAKKNLQCVWNGGRMCAFSWYWNQRSWTTVNGHYALCFKIHAFLEQPCAPPRKFEIHGFLVSVQLSCTFSGNIVSPKSEQIWKDSDGESLKLLCKSFCIIFLSLHIKIAIYVADVHTSHTFVTRTMSVTWQNRRSGHRKGTKMRENIVT